SAQFFSVLGVHLALGRDFLAAEDRPGSGNVVILSHAAWSEYFSSSPDIVGRKLTLNDQPYTVVGILPRDFSLVARSADFQSRNHFEIWPPRGLPAAPEPWRRGTHPLSVVARLKTGTSVAQAQSDLNRIAANLQRLYPDFDREAGISVSPLAQYAVANVRP